MNAGWAGEGPAVAVFPPVVDEARRAADLAACAEAIRHGSRSFHAASLLLPRRVREPSLALYAFCRLADDAVDEVAAGAKARAVDRLRRRLDAVYAGRPADHPADRAMSAVVEGFEMPRALPEALIEGLAWDAEGRTYATLSDLHAYSARVAGAVGAMMTVLMGVRDAGALARACDLGNAMQLTNIARDVGEDARAGRLFLPLDWLAEAGVDPEALLAAPRCTPALAGVVERLLREADRLYRRAEPGIAALPWDCRPAIHAASRIYGAIGARVRAAGCNSVDHRARTGGARKLGLAARAVADSAGVVLPWAKLGLREPPLPETRWLVEAAARAKPAHPTRRSEARVHAFIEVLAQLEARDRRAAEARRPA